MQQRQDKLPSQLGSLTPSQFAVLKLRSKGYTQLETAKQLGTSRANVSMIEHRARKRIDRARITLRVYESSILSNHPISVEKGTRLQEVPSIVLHEADRFNVHLRSNLIEIIRMVKSRKPVCIRAGRTTKRLDFMFTQAGKLSLS